MWDRLRVWWRGRAELAALASAVPGQRYRSAEEFRDEVFEKYGFTPQARALLRGTRLEVRDLSRPVGGGGWYGPRENRIVLSGVQAEACIHEFAHAWADLSGLYTEREPGGPPWPTRNPRFRADVRRAAEEPDPRYGRVRFLARQYEYGDPSIGFPGMGENDAERYAGLASGVMADIHLMPPYVRRWYQGLFTGDIAPDAPRP
ncbi:MAG: hypothetical protein IRY97_04895 [Thermomicrobiaceae bacterium]|nr:hypothetical protein [Thermomicrobiaceae bacterium]